MSDDVQVKTSLETEGTQQPPSQGKYRFENDGFGQVQIPADKYWGAQTQRATAVFSIGREKFPPCLIRTFALQKTAAARANQRLGCLDDKITSAIVKAAAEVRDGCFDDHFPLTVWQTGSGTQTNMNVNEVIANRANQIISKEEFNKRVSMILGSKYPVHPNDHVNRSQSSNDSFPTVMHIVTLTELLDTLIPSLSVLETALNRKAVEFECFIKIGRTHLMDAVPMTMGQSFDAFARQIGHHIDRVRTTFDRLRELPQGGTAVGSGINVPPGFDSLFCEELNTALSLRPGVEKTSEKIHFVPSASKFESMGCHDALVDASGVLNGLATSLLKIATDLRFLGSGPRCGLAELVIPHDGLTSSIMPGKRNPTLAEVMSQIAFQVMGNHTTVSMAGAAGGHFELNVAKPVIIYNVLQSIELLAQGMGSFTGGLVEGLKVDEKVLKCNVDNSLLLVTALNPVIGYDAVCRIMNLAMKEDLTPKEVALKLKLVTEEIYDATVNPAKMIGLALDHEPK
ncbi:hypothetical protein ACHAPO_009979 [Fusarium lateritium]